MRNPSACFFIGFSQYFTVPSLDMQVFLLYTVNIYRFIMGDCYMFSVGDRIVYPMHGAGIIRKIEEKEILGQKRAYYILQLPGNDMNVMIPVEMDSSTGIRGVVPQQALQGVADLLRSESTQMSSNWNQRYRDNLARLKSGDLLEVARVIKGLMWRDHRRGLSNGERKMLHSAKQILISEVVLVEGTDDYSAVEQRINEAMMLGA